MKPKTQKGYISATIDRAGVALINKWAINTVPQERLFFIKVDNKLEGGFVAEEAHLTLFFGLDNRLIDKEKVSNLIDSLHIPPLEISGLGIFSVKKPDCNILYLGISDNDGNLKRIHDRFLEFPHFKEDQSPFTPHITIAYVRRDFDENSVEYHGPPQILISKIEYKEYNGD